MSEAKTKAVQAEAKQEAKTVAKAQETMVYAGPTILGVATHNQFFNNGLPDGLKTAMEKELRFTIWSCRSAIWRP